ncbi:unnamed protein product [Ectocarpus sp. 13 AM-2016]
MTSTRRSSQPPRGAMNALHDAAFKGSTERTAELLATGSWNINQGTVNNWTPLIFAASMGHSSVLGILLSKGANVSIVTDTGVTALHVAVEGGHAAATRVLAEAGADLNRPDPQGFSPLHVVADFGFTDVMRALIDAGANVDIRTPVDGETPLFRAMTEGQLEATRELLRANANPLITRAPLPTLLPLDSAARNGNLVVMRELIQRVGIEGCGGESRGGVALLMAGEGRRVAAMALLTHAGVVDTGQALTISAGLGREASVKYLLQNHAKHYGPGAYVNVRDRNGTTPLLSSIYVCGVDEQSSFPRVARLLVDAGADTTTELRRTNSMGVVLFSCTPLKLTVHILQEKKVDGTYISERRLRRLEGIRRLLLQVEAVHAESWLWPCSSGDGGRRPDNAAEVATATNVAAPKLGRVLPILRRRVRRPGVVWTALCRKAQRRTSSLN